MSQTHAVEPGSCVTSQEVESFELVIKQSFLLLCFEQPITLLDIGSWHDASAMVSLCLLCSFCMQGDGALCSGVGATKLVSTVLRLIGSCLGN